LEHYGFDIQSDRVIKYFKREGEWVMRRKEKSTPSDQSLTSDLLKKYDAEDFDVIAYTTERDSKLGSRDLINSFLLPLLGFGFHNHGSYARPDKDEEDY
jgi:hypothetical protein